MDGLAWVPLGYSLAAGALASFNPCAYAILPGFVAHYIGAGQKGEVNWAASGKRGLMLGFAATLALVLLFSVIGAALLLVGQRVIALFPWNQLAIGIVLMLLAVRLLLTGHIPGMPGAHRALESLNLGPQSALLFGFTYGIGSLGCTLTPFLIVAASALAAPGLVTAFSQFVSFGVGMGGVIIAISLGASLFKGAAIQKSRHILPHLARLGAYLMLGAGAYLLIQWLRTFM